MWRLARISVFIMAVLFCTEIGILATQRLSAQTPFAAYTAIMPGQPVDAVIAYPCHLQLGIIEGVEASFCQFAPEDGFFATVTVVEANFVITRISFVARPDSVYVGDLAWCWGQPTTVVGISVYGSARIQLAWGNQPRAGLPSLAMVELHWGDQTVADVSPLAHLGAEQVYFQPVTSFSIEDHEPPCQLG
jgi:hypothetical protein